MRQINYIVIHHAAVDQPDMKKMLKSIDNNHKSRLHPNVNWYWYHIAYHYVIWVDWETVKTRPEAEVWYHASNLAVNKTSLGIMLSGNLDKHEPTNIQLITLVCLVQKLKEKYPKARICYHKDFAKKTCPWTKFPYDLFTKMITMASKFKAIFEKEVSDPVFTEHEDYDTATIADIKYLIDIWLARSYWKMLEYIDKENNKDRNLIAKTFNYLKWLIKK